MAVCVCAVCVGLQHEGIFRVSGSQVEVNDIKNAFERGKNIVQQETFVFWFFYCFVFFPAGSPSLSHLSSCLYIGEDPLAGDQNDHDMDSIAGVLKLYFRGLDQALFPKEVFHDLISCVCKSLMIWSVFVSVCIHVSNLLSVMTTVCSSNGEPPGAGCSH